MKHEKINPFGIVNREEIQQADEQSMGKHAVTKNTRMEETDVETSIPMSSADVKELWKNWREAKLAKKEALLKGK